MKPPPLESWVNNLFVIFISCGISVFTATWYVTKDYITMQNQVRINTERLNYIDRLELPSKIATLGAEDTNIKGEMERRLTNLEQAHRDMNARLDRIQDHK